MAGEIANKCKICVNLQVRYCAYRSNIETGHYMSFSRLPSGYHRAAVNGNGHMFYENGQMFHRNDQKSHGNGQMLHGNGQKSHGNGQMDGH